MRWTEDDLLNFQRRAQRPTKIVTSVKAKTPKYHNVKTTGADGVVHDSGKEHRRWCELELLECAGEIRCLRRQVPFALVVSGVLVCTYIADFVYEDGAATIVEDCKSPPTRKLAAYRIKVKLMQAIHNIQIREV
jgi:hypothetical protein